MIGLPWGPCNDANLNANHPALLAGLRCNGDVQIPYRSPITADTHSSTFCSLDCDQKMPVWQLTKDAQITQAAQAGYAADYQNKRLPIAVHEVKEWMKAQSKLIEELEDQKPGYLGARLAKRMITDCYARGVCRGTVECTNLLLFAGHQDPTKAESIKTAPVTDIALAYALRLLDATASKQPWPAEPRRQQVDGRNRDKPKAIDCPFWTAYGGRGTSSEANA